MAEDNHKENHPKADMAEIQSADVESSENEKNEELDLSLTKPDVLKSELQVAEMPESSELQKRRQQTKAKLREFSEGMGEEESNAFADTESGGLRDILSEAGLSTRHLKFCLGLLVLAGLVLGGFFGGSKILKLIGDFDFSTPETVEDTDESTSNSASSAGGLFDDDIETGIRIGFEESYKDYATSAGESLGSSASSREEYAQMVEDFGTLYNLLEVDVNDLLDQSNDRSFELHKYVAELEQSLNKAELNLRKLEREEEDLVDDFESADSEKSDYEEEFFAALGDLDGDGANQNLEDFIDSAKETTEIRANYRARVKLSIYFERGIEAATLRLKDLNYNAEALVKGVRVVDIAGSDLNLVIDESEL